MLTLGLCFTSRFFSVEFEIGSSDERDVEKSFSRAVEKSFMPARGNGFDPASGSSPDSLSREEERPVTENSDLSTTTDVELSMEELLRLLFLMSLAESFVLSMISDTADADAGLGPCWKAEEDINLLIEM
jgi:hypothetical protein